MCVRLAHNVTTGPGILEVEHPFCQGTSSIKAVKETARTKESSLVQGGRITLDFSRDAMDEKEPLLALVGVANEADADDLNGFTT